MIDLKRAFNVEMDQDHRCHIRQTHFQPQYSSLLASDQTDTGTVLQLEVRLPFELTPLTPHFLIEADVEMVRWEDMASKC